MYNNIGCLTDASNEIAMHAHKQISAMHNVCDLNNVLDCDDEMDLVIILGGDGQMLRGIHRFLHKRVKFYGINYGTIGFLTNNPMSDYKSLLDKIYVTNTLTIHPLSVKSVDIDSDDVSLHYAINELSVLRKCGQAAHLRVLINDIERMPLLIADGLIVSTPIGSTAYNCSLGGNIVPLDSELIAITPISPFRPRYWRGALIHNSSIIQIEILHHKKREVCTMVDFIAVKNTKKLVIEFTTQISIDLLFDIHTSPHERVMREQFLVHP